jgi:hypothetical protein
MIVGAVVCTAVFQGGNAGGRSVAGGSEPTLLRTTRLRAVRPDRPSHIARRPKLAPKVKSVPGWLWGGRIGARSERSKRRRLGWALQQTALYWVDRWRRRGHSRRHSRRVRQHAHWCARGRSNQGWSGGYWCVARQWTWGDRLANIDIGAEFGTSRILCKARRRNVFRAVTQLPQREKAIVVIIGCTKVCNVFAQRLVACRKRRRSCGRTRGRTGRRRTGRHRTERRRKCWAQGRGKGEGPRCGPLRSEFARHCPS